MYESTTRNSDRSYSDYLVHAGHALHLKLKDHYAKHTPQKAQNSLLLLESNKDTCWSAQTPCEIDDTARQDMHIDACSYLAHVSGAPPARDLKGTTLHGRLSYPPSIRLLLH